MKQLVQGEGEYAEEKWTTEDATEEQDGETKHQGQQTERYITTFRDRAEGGYVWRTTMIESDNEV